MTGKEKISIRKKIFPVGMFLILFLIQALIVTVALSFYFINTGKKRIADMEQYTRNFSITMADAFADVAELSFRTRQYRNLLSLFREKIRENTIDEAFFVLNDGKIIVHSNRDIEKELSGNIANDEFTYNIEMILAPSRKKSHETFFSDYNIISERNPFPRDRRELIEKYLYPDINVRGWLVSRAVYSGKKPVGTVNFLISKKRIFDFIKTHIEETLLYLKYGMAGSLALAFLLSLIILFRYRSIQKKALRATASMMEKKPGRTDILKEKTATTPAVTGESGKKDEPLPSISAVRGGFITIDVSSIKDDNRKTSAHDRDEGEIFMEDLVAIEPEREEPLSAVQTHVIKDAIPVSGKRG